MKDATVQKPRSGDFIEYSKTEEFTIFYNEKTKKYAGTADGTPCEFAAEAIELNVKYER